MNKSRKPILDVLRGETPQRTPIWLMRQAGRYLPEYRQIREKSKNFLSMCLTPSLAIDITLQPIRRFNMDAAILFADILLVPLALGVPLEFREGEGPVLTPLADEAAVDALNYDSYKVAAVCETIRGVKQALPDQTTLIGFCGAPWTVACYMIDGSSRNQFKRAQTWVREQPEMLQKLLTRLVDASEIYLSAQIEAGAEVLQIFDSWAGLLSTDDFTKYVITPTRTLVQRLKKKYPHVPIIGFPREAGDLYLPYVQQTGVDALSIDQSIDAEIAKKTLQKEKPLQGNMDPLLLVKGGPEMKQALARMMKAFGPRHIVNLGHGVVPQTPPEHVAEMVSFVHGFGQ